MLDSWSNGCVCVEGTSFDELSSQCIQFTSGICSGRDQFFNFDDEVCEEFKTCGDGYQLDKSLNMCFEVQISPQ